jgi:L-threonylcarbamoyladenylate synthase
MKDSPNVSALLARFRNGAPLLHPTDTIPGLSFYPGMGRAKEAVLKLKGYDDHRPFIGLVHNVEMAMRLWEPLPNGWSERLKKIWPAPLTVLYQAGLRAPVSLTSADGRIAFRCPKLSESAAWVYQLIERMNEPLPSTSVNNRGKPSAQSWEEAVHWCQSQNQECIVPDGAFPNASNAQPSTLIELLPNGSFNVLRAGAFSTDQLL